MKRRTFLRRAAGLGPALATLATLSPAALGGQGCGDDDEGARGDGFLDPAERRTLEAVAEVLVGADPSDRRGLPTVQETGVVDFLDDLLPRLDEEIQDKFRLLLFGVEHLSRPLALTIHPFTGMTVDGRAGYLLGYAHSRFGLRRLGFRALKNLVMLAYYSHEATWGPIGYGGPWVGAEPGDGGFGVGPS